MPHKKKRKRRKTKSSKSTKSPIEPTKSTNTSKISPSNSPSQKTNKKTKSKSMKLSKKPKDPNKPKKSQSSYFLFVSDIRDSFKQKHPNKSMPQLAKLISAEWNKMSNEQKQPYIDKANVLKAKYKQKLIEYEKSQSHKAFQQKLEEWKQSQPQTKNKKSKKRKKSKKSKNNTHKSNTKIQKRGKKRKRNHDNTNNASDSESSLSSILSDDNQIFTSQPSNRKRRKIMNGNTNNSLNDSELSETFDAFDSVSHQIENIPQNNESENEINRDNMSLADVIKDTNYGKEMASTIKARQKIENESSDSDNSEEEKDSDNNSNNNNNNEEDIVLKCRDCERIFEHENELKTHEKKFHKYKCKFCVMRFMSESMLEEHKYSRHDAFEENTNSNNETIRIENGQFIRNESMSKERWITNRSRRRQEQRIRYRINQCTKDIFMKEVNDSGGIVYKKRDKPINAASFIRKKYNNIGLNYPWDKEETERFYKVLKYTGMNFQFMETIYNKAISRDKNSKWRYRDQRAIKKKYKQEEKCNNERITEITRNMTFNADISDIVAEKVKENEFVAKDEKILKDSDEESEVEEINSESDEFNPLTGYKQEIERDKLNDKERKRVKAEELEKFRAKNKKGMVAALDSFKKEQEEWRRYRAVKEQSVVMGGMGNSNVEIESEEERKLNENVRKHIREKSVVDEEESEGFNPFDDLEDIDSDDGVGNGNGNVKKRVNGYDSDRSVSKSMNIIKNGNGYDDGYGYDEEGYVEDFDMDGDPFT